MSSKFSSYIAANEVRRRMAEKPELSPPAMTTVSVASYDALGDRLDELEDILRDLLFCHGEQMAIGGGPGWQERDRKAWAAAQEYFGDEG